MMNQTQCPDEQPIPTTGKLEWREYLVWADLNKHYPSETFRLAPSRTSKTLLMKLEKGGLC